MSVKQLKISVQELTLGMFVSGLDRPWTQTPFPLQGFLIRDLEEVKLLKHHCNHVYIDVLKGAGPVRANLKRMSSKATVGRATRVPARAPKNAKVANLAPLRIRRNQHPHTDAVSREVSQAKALHQQVFYAVSTVMEQLDSGSTQLPIAETRRAASGMVDSVLRCPDAFTWLGRVKDADEFTYSHSVRCAIWAILYGRHAGLSKTDLDTLAMAVLLKDIGKTKLPAELVKSHQRDTKQQAEYESFVNLGVDILEFQTDVSARVVGIVKTHCERINGSGFPQHLQGDKIPYLGKIAGIVTFYDETTNPRNSTQPISPSRAVAKLYELRDTEFQEELVVEFIRAIGLYPTGTIVELSTGEIAVVVEQNFDKRLKPKVMLVTDATKQPLYDRKVLDLAELDAKRLEKLAKKPGKNLDLERIEIVRDIEPGLYDVDLASIRDEYLYAQNEAHLFKRFANKVFRRG